MSLAGGRCALGLGGAALRRLARANQPLVKCRAQQRSATIGQPGRPRHPGLGAAARRASSPASRRHSVLLDVETPALIVELDALEANIRKMTETMSGFPEVSLRPHAKSHKTIEVAALQLQQKGTVGVCCQKVSEAVVLADAVGDILVTNQVASLTKAKRLASLVRRGCNITAVVDSPQSAEMLASATRAEGVRLGVLVEVNVGQDRCGVDTPAEAVQLATGIAELEELHFKGIHAYHGLAQHIRGHNERAAAAAAAAARAAAAADALKDAGHPCEVVTGGGTGTFEFDAASGVYTEVQPGTYVFGDLDYARNLGPEGEPEGTWRQSLFVAATVISRNMAARRIVVDAGLKAVSYDSGPPLVKGWPHSAARIESGGDEHTLIHVHDGTALPALGDQLLLVPGHCDPTVNLHDHLFGLRGGVVESTWSVAARGPGH